MCLVLISVEISAGHIKYFVQHLHLSHGCWNKDSKLLYRGPSNIVSLLLRASVGMRVSLPEESIKIVPHRLYFQEQQAHRGGSKAAEPRGSAGAGRCWARQGSLPSLPALSTQKLLKRSLMMSIPAARPFMSNDTSITWTEVPDSYLL